MELSFALINSQNFKTMTKELITFLQTAEPIFKSECSSGMVTAAERHSPGKKCHIDTLLDVLKGNYKVFTSFCCRKRGNNYDQKKAGN